ncbi:antitoxin [Luethyella okanaganae]|uniref:Antitoxin n=1 Tax=Luethyella okanaganae TaxID=69372 RepID=A0ABW1VH15_9MICO
MGLEDLTNQAKEFLKSDQAEDISDKLLDGAADLANKVTGDKFSDQVEGARDAADKAVGNE